MSNKVFTIKNEIERPSNIDGTKIGFGAIDLSNTQVKVLERIGEGFSNQQIAEDLNLSRRTIESHIFNMKGILAEEFGYKFCDRELVIFARKMLDDYKVFIKDNFDDYAASCLVKSFIEDVNSKDGGSFIDDFDDFRGLKFRRLDEKGKFSAAELAFIENMKPLLDRWTSQKNGF